MCHPSGKPRAPRSISMRCLACPARRRLGRRRTSFLRGWMSLPKPVAGSAPVPTRSRKESEMFVFTLVAIVVILATTGVALLIIGATEDDGGAMAVGGLALLLALPLAYWANEVWWKEREREAVFQRTYGTDSRPSGPEGPK